tara:strand:+ start:119 stop:391 length:273 start_codon:yes stop_codon:yes gene_type:complete
MTTAINAVFVSATVTATDYPTRIRGVSWGTAATKGDMVVRNATATGTIVYKQYLGVSSASDVYVPDLGIRVKDKMHVTLPSGAFATFLLG